MSDYTLARIEDLTETERADADYWTRNRPSVPTLIVAGYYWGGTVGKPKSNGDSSRNGAIASMLAIMADDATPKVEDPRATFTRALVQLGSAYVVKTNYGATTIDNFEVDYGPNYQLALAAKFAGIEASLFPWKSSCYFRQSGEVVLALGYRSERVYYYPASGGLVLESKYPLPVQMVEWLVAVSANHGELPDGVTYSDLNWKEYAEEIGVGV